MFAQHAPQTYADHVVLFQAESTPGLDPSWETICPELQVEPVSGNHDSLLREPHVGALVERLNRIVEGPA